MEIYRKNGHGHLRGHRFVRACTVEMHMDMSQEAFCAEIYRENPERFRDHLDWTPGLHCYRKNPSVWPHCLGKKLKNQCVYAINLLDLLCVGWEGTTALYKQQSNIPYNPHSLMLTSLAQVPVRLTFETSQTYVAFSGCRRLSSPQQAPGMTHSQLQLIYFDHLITVESSSCLFLPHIWWRLTVDLVDLIANLFTEAEDDWSSLLLESQLLRDCLTPKRKLQWSIPPRSPTKNYRLLKCSRAYKLYSQATNIYNIL